MSTNRIGGDWNAEALEAFRAAYGKQLSTVQEQDMDERTGLPTNTISNTSPWIEHTGMWRYPSGKGPDEDLQRPFNVGDYLPEEELDEESEETMSEEEVDNLINEVLQDDEEG
jgi:hypothetical protein